MFAVCNWKWVFECEWTKLFHYLTFYVQYKIFTLTHYQLIILLLLRLSTNLNPPFLKYSSLFEPINSHYNDLLCKKELEWQTITITKNCSQLCSASLCLVGTRMWILEEQEWKKKSVFSCRISLGTVSFLVKQ